MDDLMFVGGIQMPIGAGVADVFVVAADADVAAVVDGGHVAVANVVVAAGVVVADLTWGLGRIDHPDHLPYVKLQPSRAEVEAYLVKRDRTATEHALVPSERLHQPD